ncbi:tautomerase family protein [Nocardia sp. NPDC088792]|uniref:tautomerase family protein n=1 Tax=Nocardia sp. NPDC088792 TaxID=3364332 RepID=UPI00382164C6
MPLVTIDAGPNRSAAVLRAIADGVHDALVAAIGIPPGDRFQIVGARGAGELIFDPTYLGIERHDVVFIRITLVAGRTDERKKDLYRRIVANLEEKAGVRREDVVITLTENGPVDWSVGNGVASLVD